MSLKINNQESKNIIKWKKDGDEGLELYNYGGCTVFSKKRGWIIYAHSVARAILFRLNELFLNGANMKLPEFLIRGSCVLNYIRPKIFNEKNYNSVGASDDPFDSGNNLRKDIDLMVKNSMYFYYLMSVVKLLKYEKETEEDIDWVIKDSFFISKLVLQKRNIEEQCAICLHKHKGLDCGCGYKQTAMFQPCGHSICLNPCFWKLLKMYNFEFCSQKVSTISERKIDGIHGFPCPICKTKVLRTFKYEDVKITNELSNLLNRNILKILKGTYIHNEYKYESKDDCEIKLEIIKIFKDYVPHKSSYLDLSEEVYNYIKKNRKYGKNLSETFEAAKELVQSHKEYITTL